MIIDTKGFTKLILLIGLALLPGALLAADAAPARLPDAAFEGQVADIQARIRALPEGPVRVALERRLQGTLGITAYDPPGLASYSLSAALGGGAGAAVGGLAGGLVYALNGSRNAALWRTPMIAAAGVGVLAGLAIHYMNKKDERNNKSSDLLGKLNDWRTILTAAEANPLANLTGEQANAISNPGESRHEAKKSGGWFGQLIGHSDESIVPEIIGGIGGRIAGSELQQGADASRTRAAVEAIRGAPAQNPETAAARGRALSTRLDEAGDPPSLVGRLTLGGFLGMTGAGITNGVISMLKPGATARGSAFLTGLTSVPKWGGIIGGAVGAGLLYLTYQRAMANRSRALDVSNVTAAATGAPAAPAVTSPAATTTLAATPVAPPAAPAAPAVADSLTPDMGEELRRTE